MEKQTIELDGKTYEIRLVEPETTEPKLPTLMEVFNKVKPIYYLDPFGKPCDAKYENDIDGQFSQLSTEAQCKRTQTLIAMQVIADYYNGEVDYRGEGYTITFFGTSFSLLYSGSNFGTPKFKEEEHAQLAIEILRNENLLDNLK